MAFDAPHGGEPRDGPRTPATAEDVPGRSDLPESDEPLGQEAPALAGAATVAGERRLRRSLLQEGTTALIGGMSVGFGMIAMALAGGFVTAASGAELGRLAAALAFPVGFVILLIGKSELFTENFLVPVLGVLEGRGTVVNLARLWTVSLAFNLAGAAVFSLLVALPGVLDDSARDYLTELMVRKFDHSWTTNLVQALFAGWIMTILTWLLLACRTVLERVVVIWAVAALLILGDFNHAVISSAEYFTVRLATGDLAFPEYLWVVFLTGVLGNMAGGILFVTLLNYVQARPERFQR